MSFSGGQEIYFASYVPCMYVFVCVGVVKTYTCRNMLPYWFILEDTPLYRLVHATGTRQPFWPTERSTHFYFPGNHSSFTHLPPPSTRTQYNNSGSSSSPTTPNTPQAYYGLRYSTWWRLPLCSSLYSDSEICTRYILIEPPRDIRSVNSQIVKHYTNNPLKGNEWHYRQND